MCDTIKTLADEMKAARAPRLTGRDVAAWTFIALLFLSCALFCLGQVLQTLLALGAIGPRTEPQPVRVVIHPPQEKGP